MPATISATAAARAALARVRADHGNIILHVTGGWCARTPLVLRADDLALGARDVLLAVIDGVPIYKMPSSPDEVAGAYLLDVVEGLPIGFSIEAGPGKHFILNSA